MFHFLEVPCLFSIRVGHGNTLCGPQGVGHGVCFSDSESGSEGLLEDDFDHAFILLQFDSIVLLCLFDVPSTQRVFRSQKMFSRGLRG